MAMEYGRDLYAEDLEQLGLHFPPSVRYLILYFSYCN